jgi:hypothetical protein
MNRYEKIRLAMSTWLDSDLTPTITPNGILTKYEKDRKSSDFLDSTDYAVQFELCRLWLQDAEFIQNFNDESTSYTYKHTVEGASQYYVCNGALLLAARSMELPIKYELNSPNAQLKISKKWHRTFREIKPSSTRWFQKQAIEFLADSSLDHIKFVQGWRKNHGNKILTMTNLKAY